MTDEQSITLPPGGRTIADEEAKVIHAAGLSSGPGVTIPDIAAHADTTANLIVITIARLQRHRLIERGDAPRLWRLTPAAVEWMHRDMFPLRTVVVSRRHASTGTVTGHGPDGHVDVAWHGSFVTDETSPADLDIIPDPTPAQQAYTGGSLIGTGNPLRFMKDSDGA